MLMEYLNAALEKAKYKQLEDGTWFAEIAPLQGVWANGPTVEECRKELLEVVEEWVLLKTKHGDTIPPLAGIDINVRESASF
jgi:predicted RNase H-like HicB family nuclease